SIAHVLLTRPDKSRENTPHIETEQRKPPLRGNRSGGETLATAGNASDQQPLRGGHCPLPSLREPGTVSFYEPLLQIVEAAHIAEVTRGRDELQKPRLANRLALLFENERDIVGVEHAVRDDGTGK